MPSLGSLALLAAGVVWGVGLAMCAVVVCALTYLDEEDADDDEGHVPH